MSAEERVVAGVQPVIEALGREGRVDRVLMARSAGGATHRVRDAARARGVRVDTVSKDELSKRYGSDRHQGVIAIVEPGAATLSEVEELVDLADARGEAPLILILDGIQDPQNLGAILRSAHALGAHGVVLPKHRSAQITASVVKASAGAALHVPVCRTTNIKHALDRLQPLGVWSAAAVAEGSPADKSRLDGPLALVIGSEGEGVKPTVARRCDHQVAIPQLAEFDSLNASVAAGILLYEVQRQRRSAAPS
ncbi:MAG: 23S rRNA (guanosine(2251)-2'-O)-methyltransferase RlmB [Myxococcota bacterium]